MASGWVQVWLLECSSGFRFVSGWVQVGFKFGCGGPGRVSCLVQVGCRLGSGLAVGVQVGIQVWFRLGAGWVQVWLLRFRSGFRFGSGWVQVGFRSSTPLDTMCSAHSHPPSHITSDMVRHTRPVPYCFLRSLRREPRGVNHISATSCRICICSTTARGSGMHDRSSTSPVACLSTTFPRGKFNSGMHNFGHARRVVLGRTMLTVRQRWVVKVSTACMRVDASVHMRLRKLENDVCEIPEWIAHNQN